MAFKLKNKGLKKIIGQLKNSATMHAKQAEKLESMSSPAKLQKITPSEIRKLKETGVLHKGSAYAVAGDLQQSFKMLAKKSKLKVAKTDPEALKRRRKISPSDLDSRNRKKPATKMKSPMKDELKPCQKAAAKRKFKVYPSAYANMWASNYKC